MSIRMAQCGILHDHARGKTQVMKEFSDVDLVGIYEPELTAKKKVEGDKLY